MSYCPTCNVTDWNGGLGQHVCRRCREKDENEQVFGKTLTDRALIEVIKHDEALLEMVRGGLKKWNIKQQSHGNVTVVAGKDKIEISLS